MGVHQERLLRTFLKLVSIDAPSFGEREMADALTAKLTALGLTVEEDHAAQVLGGNAGNLIAGLPGTVDLPPLLFSSHMDTVAPALGKQAVVHPDGRITSAGNTVLGADDAAGLSAILEALEVIQEEHIPHRPLELVFPVAEEPYARGSQQLNYEKLTAKEAYVLDLDGAIGTAAPMAPTILYFRVTIQGRAAHAGMSPESGIHAIRIAAEAVSRLSLGAVDDQTTINVGTIQGGLATNIVPEQCVLEGEIRGFDHELALSHLANIRSTFERCATACGAAVRFSHEIRTVAYHEPEDSPAANRFRRACGAIGVPVRFRRTFGGSDNNTFQEHGIHGLVIASAMHDAHTTEEYTSLRELSLLAELTLRLMTDREP